MATNTDAINANILSDLFSRHKYMMNIFEVCPEKKRSFVMNLSFPPYTKLVSGSLSLMSPSGGSNGTIVMLTILAKQSRVNDININKAKEGLWIHRTMTKPLTDQIIRKVNKETSAAGICCKMRSCRYAPFLSSI